MGADESPQDSGSVAHVAVAVVHHLPHLLPRRHLQMTLHSLLLLFFFFFLQYHLPTIHYPLLLRLQNPHRDIDE